MYATLCRHIKSNGIGCGSVALSGADFCRQHYHLLKRRRKLTAPPPEFAAQSAETHMFLARVEDARSLQIALNQIMQGLVDGRLTNKRGSTILHGLQLASTNLTRISRHSPKLLVRKRNPSSWIPHHEDKSVILGAAPAENSVILSEVTRSIIASDEVEGPRRSLHRSTPSPVHARMPIDPPHATSISKTNKPELASMAVSPESMSHPAST